MKTIAQTPAHRNLFAVLKPIISKIAPIIIPTLLFSLCIYCCIMEAVTFPLR